MFLTIAFFFLSQSKSNVGENENVKCSGREWEKHGTQYEYTVLNGENKTAIAYAIINIVLHIQCVNRVGYFWLIFVVVAGIYFELSDN